MDISTSYGSEKKRILILDSDRDFVSKISRSLERWGYVSESEFDIDEGLSKIQTSKCQVALVSQELSDRSGIDLFTDILCVITCSSATADTAAD